MSYTNGLDNPELYFQCKLYTGDGNDNRAITFDGSENMQPNLTWFKSRSHATWHNVYDSVRGANKSLATNANNAEETRSDTMDSFDSNGFTLGNDTSQSPNGLNTNASGYTYVAWCWKESATAGFDIVSYTGNATARTISHSLSAVPKVILGKRRSDASNWCMYHESYGNTKSLYLNNNTVGATSTTFWNDTNPTSSVFTVGTDAALNGNTDTQIAYLWSEKQGFSKFGTYVSNNTTDNAFIYTGFKPAFLIAKSTTSTNNWVMHDNKRNTFNPRSAKLYPDIANSEDTEADWDFLSNGLKLRAGAGANTFIYMAFAEAPFVNSKGVPCNAR